MILEYYSFRKLKYTTGIKFKGDNVIFFITDTHFSEKTIQHYCVSVKKMVILQYYFAKLRKGYSLASEMCLKKVGKPIDKLNL